LAEGEVLVLAPGPPRREPEAAARAAGLLVVDLSDGWAPFLFSESDGPGSPRKRNAYRDTFVALANDRITPEELFLESPAGRAAVLSTVPGELRSRDPGRLSPAEEEALERARRDLERRRKPNFLEVYGIPPTLSVLARRVEEDSAKSCLGHLDQEALAEFREPIAFHGREQAKREFEEARLRGDEGKLRAIRAVQARLVCEGLLEPGQFVEGMFDLPTHLALADFERKHDIFGWGFVAGETRRALLRSPLELDFAAFRRILAERVADAAGILEDGSASQGQQPATFADTDGTVRPVPDLIGEHVEVLQRALGIEGAEDLVRFLREARSSGFERLRVALPPPPLPPYYAPRMDLAVEIDRGDVWYEFPFDDRGRPLGQPRERFPTLTVYAIWHDQRIPLVRWRTTIGSWRSEVRDDGRVYLRYKNSDVGPRLWRHIVAAPVWIPPAGTPGRDLVTRKVLDRRVGPLTVVNTELMGPGFASAYGLAMAIHLEQRPGGGLHDNLIRTHGSVDYTSIARRYSHGCHRLANHRAVRLFGFLLQRREHRRLGEQSLGRFRRRFVHRGQSYEYELRSRGYYYELLPPVPVNVLEGRIRGRVASPLAGYFPKPGVDYGELPADSPIEPVPVAGP
jgi:hypothetical protein